MVDCRGWELVVRRTGSIQDGTNYNEAKEPLVLDDEKGAPYELPETKMQRTQGHVLPFFFSLLLVMMMVCGVW